jgi:hypothetical protein
MEIVKKKLFVAKDGREFENGQDCLDWEQSLLTPEPVHLQDEQIVGLLRYAFPAAFFDGPKDNHAEIVLKVRRSREGSGFDFWFSYNEGELERNFTGQIFGETSLCIALSVQGLSGYERSDDWNIFDFIDLQRPYQYLDSIGYFTPKEEELPENPHLKKKEWTPIYSNDYSFVAIEVLEKEQTENE